MDGRNGAEGGEVESDVQLWVYVEDTKVQALERIMLFADEPYSIVHYAKAGSSGEQRCEGRGEKEGTRGKWGQR